MKLKAKTENLLMYGYNAGPPIAIPIYTVLYTVPCNLSKLHLLVSKHGFRRFFIFFFIKQRNSVTVAVLDLVNIIFPLTLILL